MVTWMLCRASEECFWDDRNAQKQSKEKARGLPQAVLCVLA